MLKIKRELLLLVAIIFTGAFLRFYKLDWGDGLFTHPDEYHIVNSVSQLSFPNQMHPNFFSYGTVIIYLIYFVKLFVNILPIEINTFILGRFFSAFFSTMTLPVIYLLTRNFLSIKFSLLATFFTAITPGLIQQAHFTTPESALTFFIFVSLLFIIYFVKSSSIITLILSSIFFGLTLGVKISGLIFLPTILIAIFIECRKRVLRMTVLITLVLAIACITLVFVSPFIFLDFEAFRRNLEYEGGLAFGKFPVFYTRQFINTLPVIFHFEKILLFALGPSLLITSFFGFILLIFFVSKKSQINYFLFFLAFISLFGFNASLFAKWTRFIAPTFPFFAIFTALFFEKLYSKNRSLSNVLMIILFTTSVIWTIAFFSIYLRNDIRTTASEWVKENINKDAQLLLETGNMIDLPIDGNFKKISLDFYSLEQDAKTRLKIAEGLEDADYFLVQSRRVFMNHMRLPNQFPKTSIFYKALFDGSLGFEQIKQFASFPQIVFFGNIIEFPDEEAEETWSVFDHPVIRVFKKNIQFTKVDYVKFFEK